MGESPLAAADSGEVAVYRLAVDDALPSADEAKEARRPDEVLLRQYARWFCQLRWIVASVLTVVGLCGFAAGPLRAWGLLLSPTWPLATAAVLIAANVLFLSLADSSSQPRPYFSPRRQLWLQIVSDLLVLTAVVHFLGSLESPAPFMYLFHIILACIFLPRLDSLTVSVIAIGLYLICLGLESLGWLEPRTVLASPLLQGRPGLTTHFIVLSALSVVAIWSVIWFLTSRLAGTLRDREHELAATNRKLAASSVERARHMLETTHQLKAPFAAIHANTQLLLGGFCGELPSGAVPVVEKISARCAALSRQIQEMLQLANLRSAGQLPPERTTIDLAALVENSLGQWELTAKHRQICIRKELTPVTMEAVEDHLRMLVENLIANAVNYSLDGGQIDVRCGPHQDASAFLVVRDRGIGIPAEKLPRIFEDYYRTEEAVRHNRASTGLGLAIVRHVAQEMKIDVHVESRPGWGTRFTLLIPRTPDEQSHSYSGKEK